MTRASPTKRLARQANSAAELAATRAEAIELMNPALKRKFQQIEKRLDDSRGDTLRFYHNLGKICADIQDDPVTYDRGAFRLIERALGTQARSLRKAAHFARAYTDEALAELIAMKSDLHDNDFRIHWGHIGYLLSLTTAEKRLMWAKKAIKNAWPPDELHTQITRHYGAKAETPHGRNHTLPKTIPGQIRQIRDETEKWLARQKNAWNGEKLNAFTNIAEAPPEVWTYELIEDLKVARAAQQGVVEEARANIERFDRLIAHAEVCLEQTLVQRAEQDAAAATVGKAARHIDLGGSKLRKSVAI